MSIIKPNDGMSLVEAMFQQRDARIVFLRNPTRKSDPDERFSAFVPEQVASQVDPQGNLICINGEGNIIVAFSKYSWLQGGIVPLPTPPEPK